MRVKDLDDQWLVRAHLFGIYETDEDGKVYVPAPQDPSRRLEAHVIQESIDQSIAFLETFFDASIRYRERITEYHDYDRDTYEDFFTVMTRKYPVVKVHSMQVVYGEEGSVIWDIPLEMVQKHGIGSKFGMLQVLPKWGVPHNYDPAYALLFPGIVRAHHAPSMIKIVYDAGMDGITHPYDGQLSHLDDDIVRAISLRSAIHIFNILGDIVLGAGIASFSTSVDGVSQSISTTSSAENAAYSSRIIMHRKELFGEQGVPGLLETLQKKWRRPSLGLL